MKTACLLCYLTVEIIQFADKLSTKKTFTILKIYFAEDSATCVRCQVLVKFPCFNDLPGGRMMYTQGAPEPTLDVCP